MSLLLESTPPSVEAGQLWFLLEVLLLVPSPISLPAKHFAGEAAEGPTHFTLVRPFSRGLEHWYVSTKKPICPSCPQIPP